MNETLQNLFWILIFPGFVFTLAVGLIVSWVVRKVTALVQWRVGPPLFQPWWDIKKLVSKEILLPAQANKAVFIGAPIVGMAGVLLLSTMLWKITIWPETMFVGSETRGLYRSDDGGGTWKQIIPEGQRFTALHANPYFRNEFGHTVIQAVTCPDRFMPLLGRGRPDSAAAEQSSIVLVSHDIGVISRHVKTIACLNVRLHYHHSRELTPDMIEAAYGCPVDLVAHGQPHRVLQSHAGEDE